MNRTMKNFKTIAAMLLLSISSTFTFTSCKDDVIEDNKKTNAVLTRGAGDGQGYKKAYGLCFQNFVTPSDVRILNADTTEISVSKALAEKLGIQTFTGHAMGIWDDISHLPYARKATSEKLVGDRYILTVVPATFAELVGNTKVSLTTSAYFNPNVQDGQTRAGIEMPSYAAKYMDENDIIHPAALLLNDEYGYDKDYFTDEDKPKAGTRSTGEFQYITGEDMARGTRASLNKNILSFHKKLEKEIKVPCGKSGGDNAKITLKAPIDFELNYFFNIDADVSLGKLVNVKSCETGLDGSFGISPEIAFDMKKNWELDRDKFTVKLAKFQGGSYCFLVGPVPVYIKVNPSIYAGIDGKVTANFQASAKYEYETTFKGGVKYTNYDGWGLIKEMNEKKNKFTFNEPKAEVHAEAGVSFFLGCEVLFYGCAGPAVGIGPRLGATADLKAKPSTGLDFKAKVDMSLNAEAGAKLSLLGFDLAEYHKRFCFGGPWVIWEYPAKGNLDKNHAIGEDEDEMFKRIDKANENRFIKTNLPTPAEKACSNGVVGFLKNLFWR